MKIPAFSIIVCLTLGTASAFVTPGPAAFVTQGSPESSTELLAERPQPQQQSTRKGFLSQAAAAALAVGTGLALSQPQPALAAKYGGFGAGSPGVLDPTDADVDRDVLASGGVQTALGQVKGYQGAVQSMQSALQSDPQANVRPTILKELDFSKLRTTLNAINPALDEDSQRGTDRLIRVIMQDITELETANAQKPGIPRSVRRLDTMKGKLAKLEKAFSDYLAFAK